MFLKIENSWFETKEIIAIEYVKPRNYYVILRAGYQVLVRLSQEAVDVKIKQIQTRESNFLQLGNSWFHIREIIAIEKVKEEDYQVILRGYGRTRVQITQEKMNAKAQELLKMRLGN